MNVVENVVKNVVEDVSNMPKKADPNATLREAWLKQLVSEYPDANVYMLDCMLDLFFLDRKKTEEIIFKNLE